MKGITRRGVFTGFGAGLATALPFVKGCGEAGSPAAGEPTLDDLTKRKNADFYDKEGKFNAAVAKEAYFTLMAYHGFPILPVLRTDEFWALDFALGRFTEVGMGGIFYINNQRDNYLLHDIWLLPGQMIPEHWHVKTKDAAPKMEAWLVRYGMAYIYAEGTPTPGVEKRIPPSHKTCCVAKAEKKVMPGQVVRLEKALMKHWMMAGPEGAIVTEVATFHDMAGLRFSHPGVKV